MSLNDEFRAIVEGEWSAEELEGSEDETRRAAFEIMKEGANEILDRDVDEAILRLPKVGTLDSKGMQNFSEAEAAAMSDAAEQAFGWWQPRLHAEQFMAILEGTIELQIENGGLPMSKAAKQQFRDALDEGGFVWGHTGQNIILRMVNAMLLAECGIVPPQTGINLVRDYVMEMFSGIEDSDLHHMMTPDISRENQDEVMERMLEEMRPMAEAVGLDIDELDREDPELYLKLQEAYKQYVELEDGLNGEGE